MLSSDKVEVEENDITKDNDEEVEIVDKKEQPLTVVLPNKEEFEIDLNSTLYEKLSKENIYRDTFDYKNKCMLLACLAFGFWVFRCLQASQIPNPSSYCK